MCTHWVADAGQMRSPPCDPAAGTNARAAGGTLLHRSAPLLLDDKGVCGAGRRLGPLRIALALLPPLPVAVVLVVAAHVKLRVVCEPLAHALDQVGLAAVGREAYAAEDVDQLLRGRQGSICGVRPHHGEGVASAVPGG